MDSPTSVSLSADAFISCVKHPETMKDTVLHYSDLHPGRQSQASCYALCYQKAHTHYALDLEDRCLCGSLSSKGAVDCGQVCSNEIQSQVCNKTVVHAVYPVQVTAPGFTTVSHRKVCLHSKNWAEVGLPELSSVNPAGTGNNSSEACELCVARVCARPVLPVWDLSSAHFPALVTQASWLG